MKQISLASSGFELVTKRTRKRVFLDEMGLVVPWRELVGLILTLPLDCVSHNRAHELACLASHSLSNCIGLT